MLNLIRKFLRPTLREQLEAGVREALRRYADRRTAPNLRVYVSTDLVPEGMDAALWARDEAEHLRRFALQWAEDNDIARAGLRLEVILLDTKREFAFVKPVGLEARERAPGAGGRPRGRRRRASAAARRPRWSRRRRGGGAGGGGARPRLHEPLRVEGEMTLGRKAEPGVLGRGRPLHVVAPRAPAGGAAAASGSPTSTRRTAPS